jgi:hypothetical protein
MDIFMGQLKSEVSIIMKKLTHIMSVKLLMGALCGEGRKIDIRAFQGKINLVNELILKLNKKFPYLNFLFFFLMQFSLPSSISFLSGFFILIVICGNRGACCYPYFASPLFFFYLVFRRSEVRIYAGREIRGACREMIGFFPWIFHFEGLSFCWLYVGFGFCQVKAPLRI